MHRANRRVVRRTLRRYLFSKRWRTDEVVEETQVQLRLIHNEQKVVAADDRAVQRLRHNAEAADFGVNLCDDEFSRAANLLRLGFDERTWNFITLHDALNMK